MSKSELFSLLITVICMVFLAVLFTLLFSSYAKKEKKAVKESERDIEIIDETIDKRVHKKREKAFKIAGNALFVLVLAILIPLLVYSSISRLSGDHKMIADASLLVVASGSMSEKNPSNPYLDENNLNDQFSTYDVLIIHKVKDKSEIEKYDVIAYYNETLQETIIHRVIGFDEDGNYLTRGDANNATDTVHPSFEDVIGKYTGQKIDKIGAFVLFLQSYNGIITILTLVYSLFMAEHFMSSVSESKKKRGEELFSYIDLKEDDKSLPFEEEIHYKGYLYRFSESGFISKEEGSTSTSSLMRRVVRKEGIETSEEYDLAK